MSALGHKQKAAALYEIPLRFPLASDGPKFIRDATVQGAHLDHPGCSKSSIVVNFLRINTLGCCWCPGEDSNLHGVTRCYLKAVRLPIPPPGHACSAKFVYGASGGASITENATDALSCPCTSSQGSSV
jgi:hypothetical protein